MKNAYRLSAPKADALPGCATPRHAEALRFPASLTQAETRFGGNGWRNKDGTGEQSPGKSQNLSGDHQGGGQHD